MATENKKNGSKLGADAGLIRELAELLSETGLSEIEIERDGQRIKVARGGSFAHAAQAAPAPAPAATAPPPDPAPAATDPARHPGAVTSPMVGTAYLAADPTTPPFVTLGANVTKGQTVLIIDAMKTMNPIPAHMSGKVTRILIDNASPVEYGQPLMIIE